MSTPHKLQMENSGVVHMLKSMKTEDLRCMYKLLGRVSEGHKTMANCVSAHLREQGKALVTDDEAGSNALNFVQVFFTYVMGQYFLSVYLIAFLYFSLCRAFSI